MESGSRILNSVRNFCYGLLSQVITVVLGFCVRSVFIKHLNIEYLGINGLFTSILTMLSLAELGFGSAMIYALYKPIAKQDTEKAASYLRFFSKVFYAVALAVAVVGLCLLPFLQYFVRDYQGSLGDLRIYFLLFLAEAVVSYCVASKRSVFQADQKAYFLSAAHSAFIIARSVLQIILLMLFSNFYFFLLTQIACTIGENIYVARRARQTYPQLFDRKSLPLSVWQRRNIWCNVKALFLSRIGRVINYGAINILISAFISIAVVGLYSNYVLISGTLSMLVCQVIGAMTGSIGNFVAQESRDRQERLFYSADFINFWLYASCSICLFALINPFISLWLGSEYLFDSFTVALMVAIFYVEGMLQSVWNFRAAMGLFTQGKYRMLIAAALNVTLALALVGSLGLNGILLASLLSFLLVNAWYDPRIVMKCGLHRDVKHYYLMYVYRLACLLLSCYITSSIAAILPLRESYLQWGLGAAFVFALANLLLILFNFRDPSFRSVGKLLMNFATRKF